MKTDTMDTHTTGAIGYDRNDPRLCIKGTENLFSVYELRQGEDGSTARMTIAENCTRGDARLFAAASDLRIAAARILELFDTEYLRAYGDGGRVNHAVHQLREALAKATTR